MQPFGLSLEPCVEKLHHRDAPHKLEFKYNKTLLNVHASVELLKCMMLLVHHSTILDVKVLLVANVC